MNINELTSNINKLGGLSDSNRFVVMITPPSNIGSSRELMFLCDSTNLPGMQINPYDVKHKGYGLMEKRPSGFSFGDLTCTFYVDNSGKMLSFFQKWMQLIFSYDANQSRKNTNNVGSESFNYPENYWGSITILLKNRSDGDIITYEFDKCFPLDVGSVQLGWDINDTIARLPVSFSYRSYSTEATKSSPTTDNINIDTNSAINLNLVNRVITSDNVADIVNKTSILL